MIIELSFLGLFLENTHIRPTSICVQVLWFCDLYDIWLFYHMKSFSLVNFMQGCCRHYFGINKIWVGCVVCVIFCSKSESCENLFSLQLELLQNREETDLCKVCTKMRRFFVKQASDLWRINKMAAILQMTFWNAYSSMKKCLNFI